MFTITIEQLKKHLDEHAATKLEPGHYSRLTTAAVVREKQANPFARFEKTNCIGVVMSVEDYDAMKQAADFIETMKNMLRED